MRGAPVPPAEYDGEHLDTDDKLRAEGWAAGLDVWEQVGKGYAEWYLGDDTLGNAQLWSLKQAVIAEAMAEFREKLSALAAIEDYIGESGQNAARNIRALLDGTGDDNNDPRVQARRWELDF